MKSAWAILVFVTLFSNAASAEVVQGDFYPPLAMRMHQEGDTGFQAEYGSDGLAITCTVTKSSGFPALDDATCPLVKRQSHFVNHAPGIRKDVMIWRIRDIGSRAKTN
jgi:outer membrane biosynthesis protein TonB